MNTSENEQDTIYEHKICLKINYFNLNKAVQGSGKQFILECKKFVSAYLNRKKIDAHSCFVLCFHLKQEHKAYLKLFFLFQKSARTTNYTTKDK